MRSSEIKREHGTWQTWHEGAGPIRLGVSTCLLGENVRHDGGHRRDAFLVEVLGPFVEWVGVCPEVELGMGVPRPSVRLVDAEGGSDGALRMISPDTGEDFTQRMTAFAAARVAELQEVELDGYVLKKNSPSCGMARVKVWGFAGPKRRDGVGLFAQALLAAWPHLPIEEEGRLADPALRENFVERIFCRHRWRTFRRAGSTRARLVEFWTTHELLVRAHDEPAARRLGKLVRSTSKESDQSLFALFEAEFFAALARKATTAKHTNVLRYALGLLHQHLDPAERRRLAAAIADYRKGLLPLVVPLTLLRFQIRKHSIATLQDQLYFEPHPKELMLRNRV